MPDDEILGRIIGRVLDSEMTPTSDQHEPSNSANGGPLHDFRAGSESPGPSIHRAGRTERLIDKLEAVSFIIQTSMTCRH